MIKSSCETLGKTTLELSGYSALTAANEKEA